MTIEFACRAGFAKRGRSSIEKDLKSSIYSFFKHCETPPKNLRVCMLEASRGGPRDMLIKLVPTCSSFPVAPNNLMVMIYRSGTQGIKCTISSTDTSAEELKKLITFGPYTISTPRYRPTVASRMAEKSVDGNVEAGNVAVIESPKDAPPKEPAHSQEKQIPSERFLREEGVKETKIRKALLESGLPQHDIDLLRVFMRELVDPFLAPFHSENKVLPEFIEIPCSVISAKMDKEWEIKSRRGGFGALYNARISHFGYKSENCPEGEKYNTWLLHVKTILNFANGLHKIPLKRISERSGESSGGEHDRENGPRFDLTEYVPPISGPDLDALASGLSIDRGIIESLYSQLMRQQALMAQQKDLETLIKKDESDMIAFDNDIAELQRKKAELQIVLVARRAKAETIEQELKKQALPKEVAGQLKETLDKLQEIAKLAGIKA